MLVQQTLKLFLQLSESIPDRWANPSRYQCPGKSQEVTEKHKNAMFLAWEGRRGRRRKLLWRNTLSLIALNCKLGTATRRAECGHDVQSWVPERCVTQSSCRQSTGEEERQLSETLRMLPQQELLSWNPTSSGSFDHHEAAVTIPGKSLWGLLW